MFDLNRDGDVFVLQMRAGENRFNPNSIGALNACLDEVDKAEGPKALVTVGEGKFFSNGLDLDWMMGDGADSSSEFLQTVLALLGRVLTLPYISAAAINGHAFAGGGMFALAHDFRIMRDDRGYFCLPEIDLRMPLHPGMTALIQARLPRRTAHESIATGRRYPSSEALEAGIIDAAVPANQVLGTAVAKLQPLASKAHPVLGELKTGMYTEVLEALDQRVVFAPDP